VKDARLAGFGIRPQRVRTARAKHAARNETPSIACLQLPRTLILTQRRRKYCEERLGALCAQERRLSSRFTRSCTTVGASGPVSAMAVRAVSSSSSRHVSSVFVACSRTICLMFVRRYFRPRCACAVGALTGQILHTRHLREGQVHTAPLRVHQAPPTRIGHVLQKSQTGRGTETAGRSSSEGRCAVREARWASCVFVPAAD
jgi:hypothetical protein